MKVNFDIIFKNNYDSENIEKCIEALKNAGATQMQTVKFLKKELNISLIDADKIILNSNTWSQTKQQTTELRNDFFDFLDKTNS